MAFPIQTYAYTSKSFSLVTQIPFNCGCFFKSDGTKFYVIDNSNNRIVQYAMSSAWDMSTASYDSKTFTVSSQDTNPRDIHFKNDGTKFYITGFNNGKVYQYSMSSAWDISTASYDSKSLDVSSEDTGPYGLSLSYDGTHCYITGSQAPQQIYQYDLTTAWDLSTGSYASKAHSVTNQDSSPVSFFFETDGITCYMLGYTYDSIYQYTCSTAWDVSTISYTGIKSLSVATQDSSPLGIYFRSDGQYLYVSGYSNKVMFQYEKGDDRIVSAEPFLISGLLDVSGVSGVVPSSEFQLSSTLVSPSVQVLKELYSEPFTLSSSLPISTVVTIVNSPELTLSGSLDSISRNVVQATSVPFQLSLSVSGNFENITLENSYLTYQLILTGKADGETNLTIPISSFQIRKRNNAPTFMQVTTPWVTEESIQDISDRSNGTLRLYMQYNKDGEVIQSRKIASVYVDDFGYDKGPNNQSLTIKGYKTHTFSGKICKPYLRRGISNGASVGGDGQSAGSIPIYVPGEVVPVEGLAFRRLVNGKITYRFATPMIDLDPGDTVQIGDDSFTAGLVTTYCSLDYSFTEVEEA